MIAFLIANWRFVLGGLIALGLASTAAYVVHRMDQVTLEAKQAELDTANRNIAVEQSARQAAEKAAQDLQKAKDDADKAIRDADARTALANAQLEQITEETANAPDSDKICTSPALWRAADRLFSIPTPTH